MLGGPLAEDRGFILHTALQFCFQHSHFRQHSDDHFPRCAGKCGTDKQPSDVLVALGYASWEKGQLEQEILDNAWLTARRSEYSVQNANCRPLARGGKTDWCGYSHHAWCGRTRLMSGTLLAFDFGTKSIGVAVGQRITGTARPLPAIKAQDGTPDWNIIERLLSGSRTKSSSVCR